MISPISTTDKYIVQPSLLDKHRKTLEWISTSTLWKRELIFFQKLLDQYAQKFSSTDDKKKVDHFQSLVIYYRGELIDALTSQLRAHEKNLADMLETHNELNTQYFQEHGALMGQLESFNTQFTQLKEDLFLFIEKAM